MKIGNKLKTWMNNNVPSEHRDEWNFIMQNAEAEIPEGLSVVSPRFLKLKFDYDSAILEELKKVNEYAPSGKYWTKWNSKEKTWRIVRNDITARYVLKLAIHNGWDIQPCFIREYPDLVAEFIPEAVIH